MSRKVKLLAASALVAVVALVCFGGAALADDDCLHLGSPPNDNGHQYGQTVVHDGDGSGGDQVRWAHGKNSQ